MTDDDLPPEFRRRNGHRDELPAELPLDDDLPPPLVNPDRAADEQRHSEQFLRAS